MTHILDYEDFYGGDASPEKAGPKAWSALHGIIDHFPCPPCREVGKVLISGVHDVVNVHLGKKVYDREKLDEFFEIVKDTRRQVEGEIPPRRHELE